MTKAVVTVYDQAFDVVPEKPVWIPRLSKDELTEVLNDQGMFVAPSLRELRFQAAPFLRYVQTEKQQATYDCNLKRLARLAFDQKSESMRGTSGDTFLYPGSRVRYSTALAGHDAKARTRSSPPFVQEDLKKRLNTFASSCTNLLVIAARFLMWSMHLTALIVGYMVVVPISIQMLYSVLNYLFGPL